MMQETALKPDPNPPTRWGGTSKQETPLKLLCWHRCGHWESLSMLSAPLQQVTSLIYPKRALAPKLSPAAECITHITPLNHERVSSVPRDDSIQLVHCIDSRVCMARRGG
jgi:hypothetical protein